MVNKKYKDSDEFLQIAKDIKKTSSDDLDQELFSQKEDRVVVEGRLENYGVVIRRKGTYKLMKGTRKVCILKSGDLNLDPYINHKVRIKGILVESDFDIPSVKVEEVKLLK